MRIRNRSISPTTLALLVALILEPTVGPPAAAQEQASHLVVTVTDEDGGPLPGVSLDLSGVGATRTAVTDSQGRVRFLKLDPGVASIEAKLEGFATIRRPEVRIGLGSNTTAQIVMQPEIREAIVVTDEEPLLDEDRVTAGVTLSQLEIDSIPTTRNPWDLLTRAPGVVTDRINVGGSESYNQYAAPRTPGTRNEENNVLLDGSDVTDMSQLEFGSQMFFDLDQVVELQLATGGADVTRSTAGTAINFVTRRGTNDFRGSARFEVTDRDGLLFLDRSEPSLSSADLGPGQQDFVPGAVERVDQWGFEAGGAAIRNRLWFWGSYGIKDGSYLSSGDAREGVLPMASEHSYASFKVNAQASPENSVVASWNTSDRNEDARDAGPTRPLPTAWSLRGPAAHFKAEDTHIFSSSFFLTGSFAKTDTGFDLISNAVKTEGDDARQAHFGADGIWRNSHFGWEPDSSSEQYQIDGSFFFTTRSISHELKFGARLREFDSESAFAWANDNAWSFDFPPFQQPFVVTQRGLGTPVAQDYTSAWVQDTMTLGRLTLTTGLRYDLQEGENLPAEIEGNLWLPAFHPALSFSGADAPFDWETISPRIALTYAAGDTRRTLLRASFARFAQQLTWRHVNRLNPASYSYTTLYWFDQDGSGDFNGATTIIYDGAPVLSGRNGPDLAFVVELSNWDPSNPNSLTTPNRTDPGLDPELTDEVILGLEHAIRPELVLGAALTLRRTSDILEERALVRPSDTLDPGRVVRREDFVLVAEVEGELPSGSAPFTVEAWGLREGLQFTGGTLLTNGERERLYRGVTLSATKRLSNRWMARGYLQLGEAEWDVPASFFETQSPNRCARNDSFGCNGADGGTVDGGLFAARSGFNRGSWSQSDWQFNLSGLYQLAPDRPWGIDISTNIFGRQGYPLPYQVSVRTDDGEQRRLLVFDEIDRFRLEDVLLVDLRLAKEFAASGGASFTVALDVFNVFNDTPVLKRDLNLSRQRGEWVEETLGPRIWRLGVRLSWK